MAHIKLMTKFVQLLTKFTDTKSVPDRHTDRQTDRPTMRKLYAARETGIHYDDKNDDFLKTFWLVAPMPMLAVPFTALVEHYGYFAEEWKDSDTRLSSDNHLVDGPTDRPTDRPT
ncbi:hypothetical protein DPMN_134614 [Dreissena polymorpha]|uniref:Uncharacterized protein n=1 Tax=Dreissena polymorpha TaxID=45954 RepID=A0A9D4G0E9_DREPO|nr:hypothetical protein DPMN_134614 [Dreissena polymorpha]